jgi:hypothetical protein
MSLNSNFAANYISEEKTNSHWVKGKEAREVNRASGVFTAHYDGTKGKERLGSIKRKPRKTKS